MFGAFFNQSGALAQAPCMRCTPFDSRRHKSVRSDGHLLSWALMRHLEGILDKWLRIILDQMGPKRANGPRRGRIYGAGYQTVYIGCTALKRELHSDPRMLQTYYVFNDFVI